jgi:hypothetical protein
MDELDFDPNRFVFVYPVWTCARPGTFDMIGGNVTRGGKFIAVFTDEDLADRFLESRGLSGCADLLFFEDKDTLAGALKLLQQSGFTHVAVDPAGVDVGEAAKPIDNVIRDVEDER